MDRRARAAGCTPARSLVLAALAVALLPSPVVGMPPPGHAAASTAPVVRRLGELDVDWSARAIAVLATGRPRPLSPQASIFEGDLRQQAQLEARSRLEEVLRGLPLDATRTLGEAAATSAELAGALATVAAGLRATGETTLSDGTVVWRGTAPLSPLDGWASVSAAGLVAPGPASCTGLMLDARGLKEPLRPVLQPAVRDPGGRLLLRPSRPVVYCSAPEAGLALAGSRPLQLRAAGTWGALAGDALLAEADLPAIAAAFPEGSGPLVILVTAGPPTGPGGREEP